MTSMSIDTQALIWIFGGHCNWKVVLLLTRCASPMGSFLVAWDMPSRRWKDKKASEHIRTIECVAMAPMG